MSSKKKGAVLASVLVAGLMLMGTACGGSSKSSDSASSSGDSSSATTAKPSSGGGDSSKCVELFNKTEELSAKMDAMDTSTSGDMAADMDSAVKTLESFTSQVPSEIRDDWKTIVSGFKSYADALDGVNFNNLTDPATMEKLTKAGAALDDPKMQKAYDNIEAWTNKNCPSLATK